MRYKRTFVTLKSKEQSTLALGRCILESYTNQSKISISVQGLKQNHIYTAYAVYQNEKTKKTHTSIVREGKNTIGHISTDKRGRGELKISTQSLHKLHIESMQKILIIEKNGLNPVLEGITGFSYNALENTSEEAEAEELVLQEQNDNTANDLQNSDEKNTPEKSENKELTINNKIMSTEPQKHLGENPKEENLKLLVNDKTTLTETQIHPNEKSEEVALPNGLRENIIQENKRILTSNKPKTNNRNRKNLRNIEQLSSHEDIEILFKHNKKAAPFKYQTKEFSWVNISLREAIYLPINFWALVNDPFVVACFNKHNHLILGAYEKEYLLGIPDVYSKKNKTKINSKGFVQFKCCEDIKLEEGVAGYWIMPIYGH